MLVSPGLRRFAVESGLWDPSSGRPFNFFEVRAAGWNKEGGHGWVGGRSAVWGLGYGAAPAAPLPWRSRATLQPPCPASQAPTALPTLPPNYHHRHPTTTTTTGVHGGRPAGLAVHLPARVPAAAPVWRLPRRLQRARVTCVHAPRAGAHHPAGGCWPGGGWGACPGGCWQSLEGAPVRPPLCCVVDRS